MNKNNDPFAVLVGKAGVDLIAADNIVGALALGQIGVFSWETKLSVSLATVTATPNEVRKFFLAVGVDTSGDGAVDNYIQSPIIERGNVTTYNLRCYNPAQPWIFDLTNFTAECDEDYAVKFHIGNGALRQLSSDDKKKSYPVHTGCCTGCEDCPTGDCIELAELLINQVNNDLDGIFTATARGQNIGTIEVTAVSSSAGDVTFTLDGVDVVVALAGGSSLIADAAAIAAAFDALAGWGAVSDGVDTVTLTKVAAGGLATTLTFVDTDTTSATVTIVEPVNVAVTDFAQYRVDYPDACLAVRFTSVIPGIQSYCNINPNYVKFREYYVIPTLADSFACNGEWVTIQEMSHEEGSGYDVAWEEYEAGGWKGNPGVYRQSGLHGLPRTVNINAIAASKYVVLELASKIYSVSGFSQDNLAPVETRVAVPYGEDLMTNLVALLDLILTGVWGPLTDSLTACPGDGTTVQMTNELTYDTDGFG